MTCEMCGEPTGLGGARGRMPRYCSNACKQKAYRQRRREQQPAFPKPMADEHRWVRAAGKRPITVGGAPASSTDPATWATLAEVQASPAGDGFGFMLGGGIGCYDLDNAVVDWELRSWAREYVAGIAEKIIYTELSVSGTGVHVFVEKEEAPGRRIGLAQGSVEVYSRERFIRCGTFMKVG